MICKSITTVQTRYPIPLSRIVSIANSFHCDIFIECGENHINVKSYEDIHCNLRHLGTTLLFHFNGEDESHAEEKFNRIFMPN